MKHTPIDLLSLRPRDNSSAAVAEAIAAAEAQHDAVRQHVADLEAKRAGLLLDGSPADLAAGEFALAAARGEQEQVAAMLDALRARHDATMRSEALDRVHAAREEAEAALAARSAWWAKHGSTLRAMIEEGRRLSEAAWQANTGFSSTQMHVGQKYPAAKDIAAPARPEHDNAEWHRELATELSRV